MTWKFFDNQGGFYGCVMQLSGHWTVVKMEAQEILKFAQEEIQEHCHYQQRLRSVMR